MVEMMEGCVGSYDWCTNRKSDAHRERERGDGIGRRYEAGALEDKADA